MKIKKITTKILFVFITGLIIFGVSGFCIEEHKSILETVEVENIEIPVRVFNKKQPVKGLKKSDFELFINGIKTEINGFYEARKILETQAPASDVNIVQTPPKAAPRLFILIFNMSSYAQDFKIQMDGLFDRIIRNNDRLIVITNRYFLPEWVVKDKEKTKLKILEVIDKEIHQLKMDLIVFENDLKSISSLLKSRIYDENQSRHPSIIFEDFFLNYQFILEDIKEKYLGIPVNQYIKISEYLKSQSMDKWVLNFYQLGRLPILDSLGEINQIIDRYINKAGTKQSQKSFGIDKESADEVRQNLKRFQHNLIMKISDIDNLLIDDIGKVFLNSGAVVHTQLLHPPSRSFSNDFKYETITTQSESILKKLSRLTGGSIVTSNNITKFVNDITNKEDVVYFLTYVPPIEKKKNQKIEINIKDKKYHTVYDNRKRLKSFNQMMERFTNNEKEIEIASLSCNNDQITVKLKNLKMVRYEGEQFGAVQAKIKITDKQSKLISHFEKIFKGINEQGLFQVALPSLSNGQYNIVIEIKDLFAFKSVYVGDAISINKL